MTTGFPLGVQRDGIPIVADAGDRAAKYPSPDLNQRVYNVGQLAIQRWNGSTWLTDVEMGALDNGGTFNVKDPTYGAVGDGATDDQPAILAAITAASANGGGVVFFPKGTYRMNSGLTLTSGLGSNVTLAGSGMGATFLTKNFNGTWFTVTGIGYFGMRELTLDGNYEGGITGKGLVYSGTTSYHRYDNVFWKSIENTHLELGSDAGEMIAVIGCQSIVGSGQTLASVKTIHHNGTDTGARHRVVVGNVFNGCNVQLDGAMDTYFSSNGVSRLDIGHASAEVFVGNSLLGGNAGLTIDGSGVTIVGCRIAGDVILSSGLTGSCIFAGNIQTSGTFTDNSLANVCIVIHHPLTTGYNLLGKLKWSGTVNPEEVQTRRISSDCGDADFTVVQDQGPNTVRYNTPITALRTVTFPAAGRDGYTIRVIRQASCTGAFNINVGPGPLKALTAAGQWCECTTSASTWYLTAYGTL